MAGRIMIYSDGSLRIPYEIIVNSRLRRININMSIDGMKVSMPKKMSGEDIERLLSSKRKWIRLSYLKLQAMKEKKQVRKWENGEKVSCRGIEYTIEVHLSERGTPMVQLQGTQLHVFISKMLAGTEKADAVRAAVRDWLIEAARDTFNDRLRFYSQLIGVSYNNVRMKEQKTRWGSCSQKKNLNFNWKLIMAPEKMLDYVVVHELCHLKHLDHSKQFWDMVACYYPYYRDARKWLRENGTSLNL